MKKQARKILSLALAGGLLFGLVPAKAGLFDDGFLVHPANIHVDWITQKKVVSGKRTVYPGMVLCGVEPKWEFYTLYLYNEEGEVLSSRYVDASDTDRYHPFDYTFWADWDDVLVTGEYKVGMQPPWMEEPPDPSLAAPFYMSDPWDYVRPEETLPALTAPEWKETEGKLSITFAPVGSERGGYGLCEQYWFQPEGAEERTPCGRRTTVEAPVHTGKVDGDYLKELIEEYGPGDYYVSLRLMSHDITAVFHSGWSELSEAYHVGDPADKEDPEPSSTPTPTPTSAPTPKPAPQPSGSGKDGEDDDEDRRPAVSSRPAPKPSAQPAPTLSPAPSPAPTPSPAPSLYQDVPAGSQYADGEAFVTQRGLFRGMSEGRFAPEEDMSRVMALTVLSRIDGADESASGPEWYKKTVAWAVENKLSDGSDPTRPVTRQELAVLLYRHAGAPEIKSQALSAPDGGEAAPWARKAVAWAAEAGILEAYGDGRLLPAAPVTRAQAAEIFQRYLERSR